jgi:hypothetical protein
LKVASKQCISQIVAVVALNTAPGGRATTVSWNQLLVLVLMVLQH